MTIAKVYCGSAVRFVPGVSGLLYNRTPFVCVPDLIVIGVLAVWQFDWCCFYYFVRNSPVALLEALCARIFFFRFVNIGFFLTIFFVVCKVSNTAFLPPLSVIINKKHSLWYDKQHSNPTPCRLPVEMLNLWKSCILPQFWLYLRYISDESQVQTLQASLNRSLNNTLHIYGHLTALHTETGIPPLYITQNLQLARLWFRLHSSHPATIQHFLSQLWPPLLQVVSFHDNLLEDFWMHSGGGRVYCEEYAEFKCEEVRVGRGKIDGWGRKLAHTCCVCVCCGDASLHMFAAAPGVHKVQVWHIFAIQVDQSIRTQDIFCITSLC